MLAVCSFTASKSFHIVLSHQPQIFDWFIKWGEDVTKCPAGHDNLCGRGMPSVLIFAGHTHGGQLRLPFLPTLFAPGQGLLPEYGDGWFAGGKNERVKMHVSRGIGATYFPLRLFNSPEVAVVEVIQTS